MTGSSNDSRAYEQHWTVRALRGVNRIYARAWHRVDVISPCRIPAEGAAILVCNHSAGIDPMLLQATCPRLITWMMAREYYELPVLRYACEKLGYIPVNRGSRDSSSLKAALRALAAGKVLGIFPEGRIEPTRQLLPFQDGVAVMAARAGVQVYPAYIARIERNLSIVRGLIDRQNATITYGSPLKSSEDGPLTTQCIQEAVSNLRNQTLAQKPHR